MIEGDVSGLNTGSDAKVTLGNSGLIDGNVYLGAGSSTFSNVRVVNGMTLNGRVTGQIDLGSGADRFSGGANAETVRDGAGSDVLSLGGGNDLYMAVGPSPVADGTDTVAGGAGTDTYDAGDATGSVLINLDKVAHDLSPFAPGAFKVEASRAQARTWPAPALTAYPASRTRAVARRTT
jgi:hypothetical protein